VHGPQEILRGAIILRSLAKPHGSIHHPKLHLQLVYI